MAISRITAVWSGFRGAPGYSNFFFGGEVDDSSTAGDLARKVRGFFADLASALPASVNINLDGQVTIIDEANGQITGVVDFTAPGTVTGTGGGDYSAASGAVVNWNTNGYRNGRRIRGRTFLVPLASAAYDSQGDIGSQALEDIRDAANQLSNGSTVLPMVVWSRPVGGAGGSAEPVAGYNVPDLGAILRSRRD